MSKNLTEFIFSDTSKDNMVKALRYTGVRIEQYETLKASRSLLGKAEYARQVSSLNRKENTARRAKAKRDEARAKKEAEEEKKYQQRLLQIEAERAAKREEARIKRNEAAKAKRALKREEEKKKREEEGVVVDIKTAPLGANEFIGSDEFDIQIRGPLLKGLQKLVGQKHAYIQFSINGEIAMAKLIDIKGGDAEAILWNNFITPNVIILNNSEGATIFSGILRNRANGSLGFVPHKAGDELRFVVLKANSIPAVRVQQKYREGLKHCILDPLYALWDRMSINSKNDGTKKRCRQVANRLKRLMKVYPDGVPQGLDMEAVASASYRCIVIHDILGNVVERYNTKSRKCFRFTNTRINHVEAGLLAWDGEYEKVTQEQMNQLIYEHDRDEVFYLYGGDINVDMNYDDPHNDKCRSLRSVRGAFAVFNQDYDIYQEFNKQLGINNYGINATKFPTLNSFLRQSRVINSSPTPLCDNPDDTDDANHIDLKKAYTQHAKCKFYRGFLGHIHEYAKVGDVDSASFLRNHVGIFQFKVLSISNNLIKKLGIFEGYEYVLPSPEIEYMMSLGIQVKLYAGCWGSTFDIEYTPEMLQKTADGKYSRYAVWAGKLGMDKEYNTYTFRGDSTWASCLKDMMGDNAVYYYNQCKMVVVRVPKKSYITRHHILAFITSYTRINMLETMKHIEENGGELIKVVLDGIYYRGEVLDVELPHSYDKEKVQHDYYKETWYDPVSDYGDNAIGTDSWSDMNKQFDVPADKISNVVVLTGAGGTGKSHSVLQNKTIPKVLYIVPTHVLGRKMKDKTGCDYNTIHKLIGVRVKEGTNNEIEETRSYRDEFGEPSCIFIDELTMIEASWIDKAIKMYPNTKIFIAGDVDTNQWYQCRNGYTGNFSKIWIPTSKHHIVEYVNDYRAKDDALKALKIAIRAEMKRIFTGESLDIVLMRVFIKNYIRDHSELMSCSFEQGVQTFKKGDVWIAGTQKTNEKLLELGVVSGYINKYKEIVLEEETGAEKRGSFTTHSFQGLTLEKERVFVSLDFFEYAMLYTSISRVCHINQLVIIV